jgi:molybdate transport system substrate-binding protein
MRALAGFAFARRAALVRRGVLTQGLALLLGVFTGCQREQQLAGTKGKGAAASMAASHEEMVVFAAASLRDVFGRARDAFVRDHPGASIAFNFAGSQDLRAQLEQGARADVFASADQRNMQELLQAGRVASPAVFARNEPVLVVAKDRAALVPSFADLPRASRIVLGAPDVPIGRYSLQILDQCSHVAPAAGAGAAALASGCGTDFRTRVESKVVSREPDVRQVLAKVSLGEADAAIVYRTDANTALDKVLTVSIPDSVNVRAEYPIAVVSGSEHAVLARAWVDYLLAPAGQELLHRAGFVEPASP